MSRAPGAIVGAARAALRALGLSRVERRAAVAALVALVATVDALAKGGLARAEQRLALLPRLLPRRAVIAPERLAVLVRATARHVPRAQCLAQSLVLARLVGEVSPVDVVVKIGVRPGEEVLAAHAWVEHGGVVLNDTADVAARFPVIETRAGR